MESQQEVMKEWAESIEEIEIYEMMKDRDNDEDEHQRKLKHWNEKFLGQEGKINQRKRRIKMRIRRKNEQTNV